MAAGLRESHPPPARRRHGPGPVRSGPAGGARGNELWAIAAKLGFTSGDKAEWRQVCEKVIGRKLVGGTTGNLSVNEAIRLQEELGSLGGRADLTELLARLAGELK